MSSTVIAATWVGVPSRSRELGRLEPGDTVRVPVTSLSSRNFAATAEQLGKATMVELTALAAELGVHAGDGASKSDIIAALEPVLTVSRIPKRTPTPEPDLTAPVVTTPEGVTINAD